jgi:cytochrome c peroxidase
MKTLAFAVAALAAFGCKKGDSDKPGGGSGGGGTGPEPPKVRPSQGQLQAMPPLVLPEDPKRKEKAELGHVLFFDKRLSGGNDRACYSCHMNEDGNGGHDPIAIGSGDKKQTRHAPVIWNVAYFDGSLYWDGRAKDLETNAKAAWAKGNMGAGEENLDKKAEELGKIDGYKKLFDAAFPGEKLTGELVEKALAEYERTLICNDTAYDKFVAGDKKAMSEQQQKGFDVFMVKGGCVTCHAPPFFSTAMGVKGGAFFNVGIGTKDTPDDKVDEGRAKISKQPVDWGAFKPPSLRNVTKSAPYFHDGSVATLDEAVKLMASGGIANKNKNPAMVDRQLTDAERADLIAFFGALECPGKLEEPKLP